MIVRPVSPDGLWAWNVDHLVDSTIRRSGKQRDKIEDITSSGVMCLGGTNVVSIYKKSLIRVPNLSQILLTYFLSQKEYTSSPQLAAKTLMISG